MFDNKPVFYEEPGKMILKCKVDDCPRPAAEAWFCCQKCRHSDSDEHSIMCQVTNKLYGGQDD